MKFSINKTYSRLASLSFVVYLALQTAHATTLSEYSNCILEKTNNADKSQLVSDIKTQCKALDNSPENFTDQQPGNQAENTHNITEEHSRIHERYQIDKNNQFKPFTLMAFKPNFILAATYNHSGYDSSLYQQAFNDDSLMLDSTESQFQISIKTPIIVNLFKKDISLLAGYTNRSFWQIYNSGISRPFRETNHEPEIWLQSTNSMNIFGFNNRVNMIGVSHQSNGRGGILSRSWNRMYAKFLFEKQSFVFSIKLWDRFDESPKSDDNPDITDFMGHSELRAVYTSRKHTFSIMSRNNIESGFEKGATELSWSFPFSKRQDLRGYIQVFTGYGESLIDYNQSVNRIGFGISLSDWL